MKQFIFLLPLYAMVALFGYVIVRRYVFHLPIMNFYTENPRRIIAPFLAHLSVLLFVLYQYPSDLSLWLLRGLYASHLAIILSMPNRYSFRVVIIGYIALLTYTFF